MIGLLPFLMADIDIVPGSVQKVSQVTGETDRERKRPTDNRTETRFGLRGTDLGASFEHEGRLAFLFGDTHPNGPNTPERPFDGDSIAFCDDKDPDNGLNLDFVTAADGKYATVQIPNVSTRGFEVPNGGFSHNGYLYVFFTTDAQPNPFGMLMGRSILIRSKDAKSWELVYTLSTDRFINVSPVIVDAAKTPGLPVSSGEGLLMWATGREYRRSSPHLAFVPLDKVDDRSAIRYWTGDGRWSPREGDSRQLFHHPMVGEISVAWNDAVQRWVMMYNVEQPRTILLRTSPTPFGPWTDAKVVMQAKDAFGKYIHEGGTKDGLNDPGREDGNGDAYAPYLIPRFFKPDGTIYFLMSLWNPYNVVLMRAKLTK
ncbi:DUF4185 domain-containing protein [bacterium]|nr:MAG: DUF4185 domain-containing protein [bacterium]